MARQWPLKMDSGFFATPRIKASTFVNLQVDKLTVSQVHSIVTHIDKSI